MDGWMSLMTAFGLSTSAGLNAYIPLLTVALLGRYTSLVELKGRWETLTSGWIIALLGLLLVVEIVADKVPAVDSFNDILQTFIRPSAGAILFAATSGDVLSLHPVLAVALGILMAGGVHAVKATGRPVITATTGGTANALVSAVEDIVATLVSLLSILFPFILFVLFLLFLALLLLWWRRRRRA